MTLRIQYHPLVDPPADFETFPVAIAIELLVAAGAEAGTIHCILTSDRELAGLNEAFRNRAGPTDVLAFPYEPTTMSDEIGDIYVSIDRAREQAAQRGEPTAREVWRLFVHGLLHLSGYDHHTPESEREMIAAQERWVEKGGF